MAGSGRATLCDVDIYSHECLVVCLVCLLRLRLELPVRYLRIDNVYNNDY